MTVARIFVNTDDSMIPLQVLQSDLLPLCFHSAVISDHRVNTDVYDFGFEKTYEYTLYMYNRFK